MQGLEMNTQRRYFSRSGVTLLQMTIVSVDNWNQNLALYAPLRSRSSPVYIIWYRCFDDLCMDQSQWLPSPL